MTSYREDLLEIITKNLYSYSDVTKFGIFPFCRYIAFIGPIFPKNRIFEVVSGDFTLFCIYTLIGGIHPITENREILVFSIFLRFRCHNHQG